MIDNKYIVPASIVVILTGAVIASETGVFDAADPAVEQQVVEEAVPEQDTEEMLAACRELFPSCDGVNRRRT